ncbi:MAG: N-acetyltransferase [Pseudomonadota bacterium]
MTIRPARDADRRSIWAILEPAFRAGDTYAIDPAIDETAALAYWCGPGKSVFVAEDAGAVLGTYYLVANQGGGGAHVCNCGFVTAPKAQGRGVARAMLDHALLAARAAGFRAMQFNFVVESNTRAVEVWVRAGFQEVGRLPGAFHHPSLGYVDALVMWTDLVAAPGRP